MKKLLLIIIILLLNQVPITAQNTIEIDCKEVFLSGANIAWVNFASDVGRYNIHNPSSIYPPNLNTFNTYFSEIKTAGGNSVRWWLHTDASYTPEIESNGNIIGLSAALTNQEIIQQVKQVLDLAWDNELYVTISLFSFDLLSSDTDRVDTSINLPGNKLFLESTANIQSYIDNALTPMIYALKDHPALMNWEIFNEPEGMSTEFGWTQNQGGLSTSMADIQKVVNMIAGAIHDADPEALVTNGAWSMLVNTDIFTDNPSYKNYYSDSELIAAGGATNGTLDFYQVHYYDWQDASISPFHHPASYWQLDKPIILGEFHAAEVQTIATNNGYPVDGAYEYLYDNGYFGAWGWQWTSFWLKTDIDPQITHMQTAQPTVVNINAAGCPANTLDNDDDGVTNDLDLCPNTPDGETVNSDGCSTNELNDDDNDGVINGIDICPNTPNGESVNANGCSTNELNDDDYDGVINGADLCPSTPYNTSVNSDGCPGSEFDDDSDGVNNTDDFCEHTPNGESVDTNGCSQNQVIFDYDIRYNQMSYLKGRDKFISFISYDNFTKVSYSIKNSSDVELLNGVTDTNLYNSNGASLFSYSIDISSIDTEGDYTLTTDEGKQISFKIRENNYENLAEASLKYFYYNRASTEIISEFGGIYNRDFGHPDDQVIIHSSAASTTRPEGTIISSPKGWYDAGDYNKYIVNSGISTYTLLAAYEHYQSYYNNFEYNIPEKGGDLPDILDETIWNLDWMLTMQDPEDGGVYHKLAGESWSGAIMPSDYNIDRYVVMKTTSAALNFAAVTATAARIFSNFETEKPGYSAALLQASEDAYTWAKNNPTTYYTPVSGVAGGNYGDSSVLDEFQWAASELYISTQNIDYRNDLTIDNAYLGLQKWNSTKVLGAISLLHNKSIVEAELDMNTLESRFLTLANSLRNNSIYSGMKMAMGQTSINYEWGSNGNAANQIIILIRAYELTSDTTYLDAAFSSIDYLLGRNGTGYSYVTGFGDITPMHPHHRISEADGIGNPIPGMLVGGSNPGNQDGCTNFEYYQRMTSYEDTFCSYATNEVAINWNAPFAYIVNALQNYQNEIYPGLSIDDDKLLDSKITLYPNPATSIITIESKIPLTKIEIHSILGKKVKEVNSDFNQIDISDLSNGVYFVRIYSNEASTIKKLIKQ